MAGETAAMSYPCGSFRAWSSVIGSFLLLFVATGTLQAFGVYQDFYTTTWLSNYTASEISWIGSIQVFFELVLGILGGRLYDAGYGRQMLWISSGFFSLCYFMLSLANPGKYYQVFLTQGLGLGISIGFLFIPACTLATDHFKYNPALAVGICLAGGPLGAVVYTIMLNYMINSNLGFSWSVRAVAFLSTVCLFIANIIITIPPRPTVALLDRQSSLKNMRDWPYVLAVISGSIWLLETYFPIYFIQLYASHHGISKTLTFYSLSIINLMGVVSRIGVNAYANRFGAINLSIISCALNGCVLFGMLGCSTPAGLILFSIFYGFFFGSTVSLFPPAVAYLAPSDTDIGKILGYAWAPGGIAALIGPPLGGALIGKNYVWWRGVVFAGMCFIVAAALQLAARQLHVNRSKQKADMEGLPSTLHMKS